LKDKRPKLGEEEQVSESHCNKQSFEKKYSSKESEDVSQTLRKNKWKMKEMT
jgi:hypothetical protein